MRLINMHMKRYNLYPIWIHKAHISTNVSPCSANVNPTLNLIMIIYEEYKIQMLVYLFVPLRLNQQYHGTPLNNQT